MLKNYPEKIAPRAAELKMSPSELTIFAILNYSKSVVSKKIKNKKVLFNLN
jgi:hypothetical protein